MRVPNLQCSFLALWAHKFVNSAPCWPHGPPQTLCPGCLQPEDRGLRPVIDLGFLCTSLQAPPKLTQAFLFNGFLQLAVETACLVGTLEPAFTHAQGAGCVPCGAQETTRVTSVQMGSDTGHQGGLTEGGTGLLPLWALPCSC